MPTPTEQKTTQTQILTYAEAIGWTLVSRKEAEHFYFNTDEIQTRLKSIATRQSAKATSALHG